MGKLNYCSNKVLDKLLGAVDFTPPATWYVALFTTAPAQDGSGGVEASYTGYARKSVTNNNLSFPAAVNGSKSNGIQIQFNENTGSAQTIVCVVLMDAAANGNAWMKSNAINKPIATGVTPFFDPGDLTFTES